MDVGLIFLIITLLLIVAATVIPALQERAQRRNGG